MKTQRYHVKASVLYHNSFNVIDAKLTNRWGEQWVESVALTYEQAVNRARELNNSSVTTLSPINHK